MTGDLRRLDVDVLLAVLWARRVWWVVAAVTGLTVAVFAHQTLPPRYKAQAEVLVQTSEETNPFLGDMVVHWQVKNRLPVIQSVLRSEKTLRQVLRQVGTIDDDTPAADIDAHVRSLRARLTVFGVGGGLVRISLTAGDPAQAHEHLVAVVQTFIDEMLRPQTRAVEDSTVFLAEQLERLRGELGTLEGRTSSFKADNASELPEVYRLNLDVFLTTRKNLTEAEVRLEGALRKKQVLEERLRLFDPVAREVEAAFVQKKAGLAQLLAVFTDDHPRVRTARDEISALENQLKIARNRARKLDLGQLESMASATIDLRAAGDPEDTGVKMATRTNDLLTGELFAYKSTLADIEGVRGEVEMLRRRLGESQDAVRAFAQNERTLTTLVRESETKAAVYRNLLEKYEDALVTQELARFDEGKQVWLVDPPMPPTLPMGPALPVLLAGALAGALALALALALTLEVLDSRARVPGDAARTLGVPVLGELQAERDAA
jgi:uncharacterized protein involved in exopolysaccharide biosynthesis